MDLQTLILWFGLALVGLGVAGGGVLVMGELRVRALRKARFQDPAGPAIEANRGDVRILGQVTASVRRLGQQAAVRDPSKVSDVRMRLVRAGFFGREAAIYYLGARAAALAAATLGTIVLLPFALKPGHGMAPVLLAAILALIALLGPDQVLSMRQKDREREYADGFPDLLDLLVASVEAGLSLDAAVGRVTDELARRYPRLTIHLRMLTLELRAGKSRKEAWTAFADRLGIDDARAFATMLRQAEDMGTSLGETLSVFSQDMRQKRMLRAEEKALALPVKLTVPLILFIFPCLLGVLLLPAAFRLTQVFN
ncbi:MAG: type II secretion system F family protein [Phenylobacterium sp.]|uniref:type II secretion system F family protein n=1 Tax=Phenylobacterium sp. TaxID=1871053 RepID=UPI002728DE37|nr:type II secretion system F family protein [Phenylobacterium sp.]MDO8914247.1 type II secretion system F family protein [Phenylobacterium sp.]MDP3101185.1 type II secretion system F family protein [Phenylobacterium sp.]